LGEVYDVRDGTHDSPKYIKEGFPLITSKNLKNDSLNYAKAKFISEKDYININKRSKVDVGDVLFAMIGTIGNPTVIKNEPDFAIKNVALFKVPKDQSSHFLKYYLDSKTVINKMSKEAKGTTQKFVGLGYLRNFPIRLPPLPVQKKIVEILDKSFVKLSKAKENAEKNLKNAKEVFESYLQSVFENEGKAWETCELKNLCENYKADIVDGPFGSNLKRKDYQQKGIPVLKIQNVKPYVIILKKMDYVDKNKYLELKRHSYTADDIIMTKLGDPLGASAIVNNIDEGLIVADLVRIRAKKINTKFLCYHLNSNITKKDINSKQKGATRPRVKIANVRDLPISYPSLDEQKIIVHEIEKVNNKTKSLESIYNQKLADLEELKQSILHKAFNGELIKE
jgi:type I restriction enzyme S subunit